MIFCSLLVLIQNNNYYIIKNNETVYRMASMMNELQKDFDALMEKFQRESDKKGQINLFDLFKESLLITEQ